MKKLSSLLWLLLASIAPIGNVYGQADLGHIYWTGQGDRFGGQANAWSTVPYSDPTYPVYGLAPANGVSTGNMAHMHFDAAQMNGSNLTVNVNRNRVTMLSVTLNGAEGSGFTFTNTGSNGEGLLLGDALTVQGGIHVFTTPSAGRTLELVADSTWNIAAGSGLLFQHRLAGDFGITKTGGGTWLVANEQLYTGVTLISSGIFGAYQGGASLAGDLQFGPGAQLQFNPDDAISVGGEVAFLGPFSVAELASLDANVPLGTYRIFNGLVNFTNLANVGLANAFDIGNGTRAYFQADTGGLELVVTKPTRLPFAANFGSVRLIELLDAPAGTGYVVGVAQTGGSPYLETGDEVLQWHNQSAVGGGIAMRPKNFNHLPTLLVDAVNGRPAIRFDRRSGRGDGDVLLLERQDAGEAAPLLDTNTISYTFVFRSLDRLADQQWIASWHREDGHPNGDLNSTISSSGNLALNLRGNDGNNIGAGTPYSLEDNSWLIVTVVWDGETGRLAHYINGVQLGAEQSETILSMPVTWETLVLGNRRNMERPLQGDIAEFVLYNEVIDDETRLTNEQWLDQKYGLGIFPTAGGPDALREAGQVLHFDAGAGVVTGVPAEIVSIPPELEGKVALLTYNANSDWPDHEHFMTFEVDRPLIVSVANDPSSEPQWLQKLGFSQTAMTVETTAGSFDLWERAYNARDFVSLPGNGGSMEQNNIWIILSEGPNALVESPDNFLAKPNFDWDLKRHYWQLTTDPETEVHTSSLLTTRVGNFTPDTGFRMAVDFRVPQLQHEGENSYGLVLLGDFMNQQQALDPASGVRAEWLPRQPGGGATFRLVDNATGAVMDSVAWLGEAPVRTNDWVTGDNQLELFWDYRASEATSNYFLDDEDREILRMPEGLDPGFMMEGIRTANDLSNTSNSLVQFTVESGNPSDGNPGVTVFVAWDVRISGFEPTWLREDFVQTDHFVEVSSPAKYHRLWAREFAEGSQVTLPGASAGGAGPYPAGSDNYFVLLGDVRPGLETIYRLEAEGFRNGEEWSLTATLTDGNGLSQAVQANLAGGIGDNNNVFGVVVRHPDRANPSQNPVTPIWQTLAMSMDFHTAPMLVGFDGWREQHFTPDQLADPGISGPVAAPAGDGVTNLIKYALDLRPFVPVAAHELPRGEMDEEERLILIYVERSDVNDILYIPEVSEDLKLWRSGPEHIALGRSSLGEFLEKVTARAILPGDAERGYMRLKVELTQ